MLGGSWLIVTVGEDPPGSLRAAVAVRASLQLNVVVGENVEVDPERVKAPLLLCSERYVSILTVHSRICIY